MRTVLVCAPGPDVSSGAAALLEALPGCLRASGPLPLWLPGGCPADLALPEGIRPGVLCPPAPLALPERQLAWLAAAFRRERPDLVVVHGGGHGHELAVRAAARLGLPCVAGVQELRPEGGGLTALRKACGFHLDWALPCPEPPAVLSMALGPGATGPRPVAAEPQPLSVKPAAAPEWLLDLRVLEAATENPLETAKLLFVGGRGLGGKAACDRLRALAEQFGAAVGFTRPAAMNGWCGLHEIVGQSGTRTAARTCVAFGVSGAAAFLAGIQNAGTLVAVNTDPAAPIFRHADLGVVAEAESIMEAMEHHGI